MIEWLVGILGILAAALGLFFGGRATGKAKAEAAAERTALDNQIEALNAGREAAKERTDVEAANARLPDGAPADRLRNDWSRGGD